MTNFLTRAADRIKSDEGYKDRPYKDHLGNWTIGYGTLIDPIPKELADLMLDYHFKKGLEELRSNFSWLEGAPDNIIEALTNMHYNLGMPRLKSFKMMLMAIEAKDYDAAAFECFDSQYALQVPERAARIAELIRTAKK